MPKFELRGSASGMDSRIRGNDGRGPSGKRRAGYRSRIRGNDRQFGLVLSSATLTQRWRVRCPHCRWYTTSRRHRPPSHRPRTPGPRRLAHTPTEVLRSGARQRRVRQRLDPDSAKERTIPLQDPWPPRCPGHGESRAPCSHAPPLDLPRDLPHDLPRGLLRDLPLDLPRDLPSRPSSRPCKCPSSRALALSERANGSSSGRVPSRAPSARPTRSSTPYVSAVSGSSVSATWISSAFQPGNATLCGTTR